MSRAPDLSHQRIVRALQKTGFVVKRQGKHIFMHHQGRRVVAVIPRHNPVKRRTLAKILSEAGISLAEFTDLL